MSVTLEANLSNTALQITQSGSGDDIQGTSDTWSVTKAGLGKFTKLDLLDNQPIEFGTGNDATIQWDGSLLNIAGVVDFDNNVTMQGTLGVVSTLTVTAAGGSAGITLTNGDVVVSDGSLTITDADNANTVTITNNTVTDNSATTGGIVEIRSTSLTTGTALNIELTEGNLNGGEYIRCYDATGTEDVFSVKEDGATTVKGVAAGTDALTITAGDVFLSDTDGTVFESENGTVTMFTIDNKAGVVASNEAVLKLDAGGNVASGGNILRIEANGTPNNAAIGIEFVGTGKNLQAMVIDVDNVNNHAVEIKGAGAVATGKSMLTVDNSGTPAASASNVTHFTFTGTATNNPIVTLIDNSVKDALPLRVVSNVASATRATVEMVQDSTTGAAQVLDLQQDDTSEGFFEFTAVEGSENAFDGTQKTLGTIFGSVAITINGTKKRITVYDDDFT